MSSTTPATREPGESIKLLKSLLRTTLRVTVTDGRIFIGMFVGTDKGLNIILINTDEFRLGPDENPGGRYIGMVLLPWRLVVRVEAQEGNSDEGDEEAQEDGMYGYL
ncbi:hypothetical protein OF83DRAFT_589693 [Amylostereum chailletii]|nr:hypothetical protein OF83DRAFT_589693 [Amylostereum chailletii]